MEKVVSTKVVQIETFSFHGGFVPWFRSKMYNPHEGGQSEGTDFGCKGPT